MELTEKQKQVEDVLTKLLDYIDLEGLAVGEWQAISALCDEGRNALAEQAAAAEQGRAGVFVQLPCGCVNGCKGHDTTSAQPPAGALPYYPDQSTHPGYIPADPISGHHCAKPAGDVVERMAGKFANFTDVRLVIPDIIQRMSAALAIAREGYVSLEDVEKIVRDALRKEADNYCISDDAITRVMHEFRARLKPAERVTDVQKVEAILWRHYNGIVANGEHHAAAEIVAALKAGHHD